MANQDAAFGFRPTRHLTGGDITSEEYTIAANYGTAIYSGQVVEAVAGGGIEDAAAGDTQQLGVFGGCFYTDPTTSKPTYSAYYPARTNASDIVAYVYDDLGTATETTSWGINGTYSFDLASLSVGYETQETSGTDSTGYFVGLTFPEVGPGSVSVGAATAGNFADDATEYMIYEAAYSYPVNDGITVTPGVIIQETAGDDLTAIFVKSSFAF